VAYKVHIASPAKREIRKLPRPAQISVLKSALSLAEDPRPRGYASIVAQKDLFRIRVGRYRVIYSVQDQLQAVIIATVRLRGEATYKNIPLKDLSAKIKELENLVKQ
jgi:mRNA interferase RelE/StbE